MTMTDHILIHFLCLTEFRTMGYTMSNQLADWLRWFCYEEENMKGLDSIMERNPAIKKAHQLYEQFTADKELMEKYEARQKYLRDVSTIKGVSHDEGFAKGREEGREEERQSVATEMKRNGIDSATIQKITGLSEDTINKLT